MSSSIQLQFNLNQDAVLGDLAAKIDRNPDFDRVVIQNVPNLQLGLELVLNDWFKPGICELPNVFGIIMKTNAEINEKFNDAPRFFEFRNKPSFLVAFESTVENNETIIFWKAPGNDEFYSIFVDGNVTPVLCDFLIQEIKAGRSGIIRVPNNRKKIHLHEIVDNQKRDLLTIVVKNGQNEVVQSLLSYDFVADNVINDAWDLYLASDDNERSIRNQIILILLAANSKLPDNFEYDRATPQIQEFINWCEDLQKDVDIEDLESLKTKLDFRPNLVYFYDRNNQSLLAYAIKKNKTKVFKTFARRLNTGSHEYIQNIYQTIQNTDKRLMRKKREQNPFIFPKTHLLVFKSKTRISSNDQNALKHWEYIEEAYETIDSIEYCSIILQVAAECKPVKIFFDFKHDSTYYMDPPTSVYSKGIIYEGGIIYIGAKDLLNETTKFNVIGVIAHELCHLAVYIGFINRNFDPFPTGGGELKTRFIEKVMAQCKQNEDFERIIGYVFKSYPKDVQDSEMIVTYPQILMQYFGNVVKIEQLEGIFDELVKYSKEVVEPELNRALNVLKLLNDENYLIKFNHLTEPMKAKILHSATHFQGVETTLFEMVGNDQEMLKDLTSENIRNVLLKNQSIEIGEAVKLEMKYEIIPRNFEKVLAENQIEKSRNVPSSSQKRKLSKPRTETRTFEQAREETNNSKVFLLADHAGSGKTTIFKDCSKKLKEFYRNSWVSFINLRKHGKIFDQYKWKTNTHGDVRKILLKIINPNQGLETSIFNKFFEEGKMIFLFDGVDEISPIYTELLMKIFAILCQMESKNEMWISTRPHYAQNLSQAFKTPYHKFTPYISSEINEFIKELLKFHGIANEETQNEYLSGINKCLEGIKGYYYQSKEIENPLMVQMVTELYIEKRVDPDNVSRYGVFEAMVEKQKEKLGEKIPNLERDKNFNLSIWDVHRVLALISLIGDDYEKELKFKLEELQIMKKWKEEKHKWTSDMIQRYGFVSANLSSKNDVRDSIDFMHRTYAEFFVAQMFIKSFSSDSRDFYVDSRIIDIYDVLLIRRKKFHVVKDFVQSFAKYKKSKNETVKIDMLKKMYSEVNDIHQMKFGYHFCCKLQYWSERYGIIAYSFDIKTLEQLWKLDKEKNLLEEYFKSNDMKYDKEITEYAKICFGSSWHENFNKSGTQLITDDEIVKFKYKNIDNYSWNYLKNLLKFCDLLDKNYKIDDKKEFYFKIKFTCTYILKKNIKLQKEIISRARKSLDRIELCENFFLNAELDKTSYEILKYVLLDIIDNDFINDEDSLRELLFQGTERKKSPLCQVLKNSQEKEKFLLIKDFYIKHKNSWEDIQDILVDVDTKDFIDQIKRFCYPEFKELVKDAFGTDFSKLITKIEDFVTNRSNLYVPASSEENLKDLLNLIFSNDAEKVTNILTNIIYV